MPSNVRPICKCDPVKPRGRYELEAHRVVRALRRAARLTQEALAAHLDHDASTIADWEHGRSRVPAYALLALEELALARRSGT